MSQVQFFPVLIKTVGSLPPHRNQFNMMTPPTYLPNHLPQVLLQFENSGAGAALSCCKAPTTRVELHLLFWSPTLLLPNPTIAQPYYCPTLLLPIPTIAHPYYCPTLLLPIHTIAQPYCPSSTKAHPMQCNGAAPPLRHTNPLYHPFH